jgi:hypothetical protein
MDLVIICSETDKTISLATLFYGYSISVKLLKMLSRAFRFRPFTNVWKEVNQGPPDPILGVAENFHNSKHPKKVNLGIGAYRDDDNKPWRLPSVNAAEEIMSKQTTDHQYLPIEGLASFRTAATKLLYGNDAEAITEDRVAAC